MASRLYALARWVEAHRLRVFAAWLVVLAVVAGLGTAFAGTLSNQFRVPGTESQQAADLLSQDFPEANSGVVQVVFAGPVTSAQAQQSITAGVKQAATVPGVATVASPFAAGTISPDKTVAFANVIFKQTAVNVSPSAVKRVEAAFDAARSSGLDVEFTGTAVPPAAGSSTSEALGVLIAYVVLAITLVSLLAAGLPLLSALAGVVIGITGIHLVARFVDLTSTATVLASMIGLAVGIDYVLFIVSRHREQLRDPAADVKESIARAIATAGSAVVFAGGTVIVALAALSVTGIPFISAMGLCAAATVFIALLVALTLTPAVLALAGERMRPRRDRAFGRREAAGDEPGSHFAARWARFVTRAPAAILVVGVAAVLVVAWPALHLRLGLPGNETQPKSSTQHKSYDLLAKGFGPGFNGPLLAVVDAKRIPAAQQAPVLSKLATTLKADPALAVVEPPVPNADHSVYVMTLVPKTGPDDPATKSLVNRLRSADRAAVAQAGGTLYIAGATAANIDVSTKLADALPLFVIVIVGLALILLTIAFRSILVPLKAVVGFLLSISASTGITVWVFQFGHLGSLFGVGGAAPIVCFLPVLLIGVLFGLAMDYEVFLVSRMREAFHHTGDAKQAVLLGVGQSGRVVTAAALIMTSVFAGFIFVPDPIVKSIALALTVGVLIDAFVVRLTLVPAVMSLLGSHAWKLPRRLERLVPRVDIEGADLPKVTVPAQRDPAELPEHAGVAR